MVTVNSIYLSINLLGKITDTKYTSYFRKELPSIIYREPLSLNFKRERSDERE